MIDMSDKFVFIYRDDDGNIINAGILVGCSFEEAEKRATDLEKKQGGHYTLSKDSDLAEVVYYFNNKRDRHYMAEVDEWEDLQNTIENAEDYLKTVKETVENYVEELKKKPLDN